MGQSEPIRVLVVEDDDDVRALVVFHLTMSGYAVSERATVDEGLMALATAEEDGHDVVLTDLNFGLDSGERLVRHCRETGQAVVVMTASAELDDLAVEVRNSVKVLNKPFALDDLSAAVSEAARGASP